MKYLELEDLVSCNPFLRAYDELSRSDDGLQRGLFHGLGESISDIVRAFDEADVLDDFVAKAFSCSGNIDHSPLLVSPRTLRCNV